MLEFFNNWGIYLIIGVAVIITIFVYLRTDDLRKAAISGAVALALGFGTKFILGGGLNPEKKEARKQVNDDVAANDSDFNKAKLQQKATLSESAMRAIANGIEQACIGTYFDGTFESEIYSEMRKIKNDTDFLGVVSAFGKRDYSNADSDITFSSNFRDMYFWLKSDLELSERKAVNKILKDNGVTKTI